MVELRIKEILKEKGLTSKALADDMGKAPQYINNIINGGKGLSINTLSEIASTLDVPISSLFADFASNDELNLQNTFSCPHCGKPIKIEKSE